MSDLIKKIKIKKQDGTYIDYIPIGAEAKNVDCSDGESVEYKLNKKPYYYNSIADMKADTNLKVGDMVITLGYYEANDGGRAEYKIIKNSTSVNNMDIIQLENNLFASLVYNNNINLKQFGIKNNTNISDLLQRALVCVDNVIIPYGTYIVDKRIVLKSHNHLDGSNANINYMASANGMLYGKNVEDICIYNLNINHRSPYRDTRILLWDVDNFHIKNISFDYDELGFSVYIINGTYGVIEQIKTNRNDFTSVYDDGIHITGHDILIQDCDLNTSDDMISIGSAGSNWMMHKTDSYNITIKNIVGTGYHGRCPAIYSQWSDEKIYNINIENVDVKARIEIQQYITDGAQFYDIFYNNCKWHRQETNSYTGMPFTNCHNIQFNNCFIDFDNISKSSDGFNLTKNANLFFNNCKFNWNKNNDAALIISQTNDSCKAILNNCSIILGNYSALATITKGQLTIENCIIEGSGSTSPIYGVGENTLIKLYNIDALNLNNKNNTNRICSLSGDSGTGIANNIISHFEVPCFGPEARWISLNNIIQIQ